jgi:SAM-dependent methyltransferase
MTSASQIFNCSILSFVIFTCNKLGLFSEFEKGVTLSELTAKRHLDEPRLRELLNIATTMDLLAESDDHYTLTPLGQDVAKNRGFFTWAIGGYSPLLEAMDTFLTAPTTAWQPFVRGEYVAIGSDEANQGLMQGIFEQVMNKYPTKCIADLGCGNAGRLVSMLEAQSELTGVGIDISPKAIEVATTLAAERGVGERLSLVCENVFTSLTKPQPALAQVELVMSFMMLHDLFNISELRGQLFGKLRQAFPQAQHFVFADTCLDERLHTADSMPIFTMGYQLIHQMRGIQLFPLSYYLEQFAREGVELVAQHEFGVPNTYLFVLKA